MTSGRATLGEGGESVKLVDVFGILITKINLEIDLYWALSNSAQSHLVKYYYTISQIFKSNLDVIQ